MVAISLFLLNFVVILESLVTLSFGSNAHLTETMRKDHVKEVHRHNAHLTPVRRYAVRGLCGTLKRKANLYKALKSKFRGIRDTFTYMFVMKLCKRRGLLVDWVRELFDIDNDGYVSHFEKNLYRNNQ